MTIHCRAGHKQPANEVNRVEGLFICLVSEVMRRLFSRASPIAAYLGISIKQLKNIHASYKYCLFGISNLLLNATYSRLVYHDPSLAQLIDGMIDALAARSICAYVLILFIVTQIKTWAYRFSNARSSVLSLHSRFMLQIRKNTV